MRTIPLRSQLLRPSTAVMAIAIVCLSGFLANECYSAEETVAPTAELTTSTESSGAEASGDPAATAEPATKALGHPTHKQIATIDINSGDLEEVSLHCFCLAPNGNLLAACGPGPGEIREFTPTGDYVTSWSLSSKPEAINVGSDGNIYVAGQGKLFRLSESGEVLLEADAPHIEAIAANPDKIREEIVEQNKQMREQFGEQIKVYEDMLKPLEEKPEEELTAEEKQQIEMFEQVITQYTEMSEQYGTEDLTEEELDKQVAANIEYKSRIASISEYDGKVFIATGAVEGYGYDVWKLDGDFTGGEVIISDLSGCCGQMDVQCCKNGIFVAENSRHRVGRYDTAGEMLTSWGKQAREGLHGFGSCCNPMNVAFGSDGTVYTAEDDTGRIKQFTPDGELVALIGKVDMVPGCKKVAIAVAKDGGNVFVLDITNNAILVMDRLKPGETVSYSESEAAGGSFLGSLKDALGL